MSATVSASETRPNMKSLLCLGGRLAETEPSRPIENSAWGPDQLQRCNSYLRRLPKGREFAPNPRIASRVPKAPSEPSEP